MHGRGEAAGLGKGTGGAGVRLGRKPAPGAACVRFPKLEGDQGPGPTGALPPLKRLLPEPLAGFCPRLGEPVLGGGRGMLPVQIGGEFLSEAHSIAPVFVGSFLQLPSREAESQGGDRTIIRISYLYIALSAGTFALLLVHTFGWYIRTSYSYTALSAGTFAPITRP